MPPKVSGRPPSSADSKSSAGGSSSSEEDRRNDLKKKDAKRKAEPKPKNDHHENDEDDDDDEEEEDGSSSGSGSDSGSGSGDDSSDSDNDDESGSSSSSSGSSSTESDSSAASQRSTTRSIAAAAAAAAAASARKNVSLSSRSGSARSSRASSSREDQSPPPRPTVKAAPKKRAPAASSAPGGQARRAQRASSASSASDTGGRSTSAPKKAPSKKTGSHTTAPSGGGHRKVAPKKSATAKPIAQATALTKSNLSESNSEDSDFGEFSLTKFTSKAKAAKNSALSASLPSTASSSASNTPKPNATPGSTPVGRTGASTSGASPAGLAATPGPGGPSHAAGTASGSHAGRTKGSTPAKSVSGGPITSMSHYGSIFNTTSEDSDLDNGGRPSTGPTASVTGSQAPKKTTTPPKKANVKGNTLKVRVNSKKLKAQESPVKRGRAPASKAAPKAPPKAPTTKVGAKATPKSKAPLSKRSVSVSSVSSSSSVSSKLSQSSSDSSDDEEVVFKTAAARKMSASAGSGPKKKGRAPSGGGNPTNSGGTLNNSKKGPKSLVKPKKPSVPMSTDESDVGDRHATARPTTRQTRGAAPRRSKHITGRGEIDSESEVDQTGTSSSVVGGGGRSSPKKNAANSSTTSLSHHHHHRGGAPLSGVPLLPPVRRDLDGLPPIETRKCPIPGCDSSGHLGGKLDRHFLAEACPVYHNTTRKACRDMRSELNKRAQVRKKALVALSTKSPLQSPTSEQKKHFKLIKEERAEFSESDVPFSMEEPPEEREPDLKPYASEWDLKLFREAQGLASEDLENSLKGLPDAKTTKYLEMGKNEMEVWYQSPYPEEFTTLPKIYLCEFCLKYMKSASVLRRHAAKCVWKHPPGDEIYRKDKLSVFEICGKRHKQYCQNLCLLAKFFLDHKTLYFDVEPFLFYVMTTADSEGCHIVGYFSKEKNSFLNYNVSCILTLPPYQRQGFGRLLIDFSYLLSRVEGKIGSPEKPLSDLGLITYRAYWKDVLLEYICNFPERETSIKSFSEEMGINSCDIVSTLQYLGMIKYWKGQHVILKKEDLIDTYMAKVRNRPKGRQIYASALKWKPYEPSSKEKRHAELIKKSQEERQKKR